MAQLEEEEKEKIIVNPSLCLTIWGESGWFGFAVWASTMLYNTSTQVGWGSRGGVCGVLCFC